jgi:hypothetical protein
MRVGMGPTFAAVGLISLLNRPTFGSAFALDLWFVIRYRITCPLVRAIRVGILSGAAVVNFQGAVRSLFSYYLTIPILAEDTP